MSGLFNYGRVNLFDTLDLQTYIFADAFQAAGIRRQFPQCLLPFPGVCNRLTPGLAYLLINAVQRFLLFLSGYKVGRFNFLVIAFQFCELVGMKLALLGH